MPPFRHERVLVSARAQRQINLFGVAHLGLAEDAPAAHNGGTARGYREPFEPLAARQPGYSARLEVGQAVCLCIVALGSNVRSCRDEGIASTVLPRTGHSVRGG